MDSLNSGKEEQYGNGASISIIDCLQFFVDGYKTMLTLALLGALLGLCYEKLTVKKYRAAAILETGYVGTLQNPGSSVSTRTAVNSNSIPIETMPELKRKMRSPTYYSSETYKNCGLNGASQDGQVLVDTLIPLLPKKDAPVDELEFTSDSVEVNISCLNSVLGDIIKDHESLKIPILEVLQKQVANLEAKLNNSMSEKELYLDRIKHLNNEQSHKGISEILIFTRMLKETEATILQTQNELAVASSTLVSPQTRRPQYTTPIYASENPVSGNVKLKVLICFFVGFFTSIIYLIGKKSMSIMKNKHDKQLQE